MRFSYHDVFSFIGLIIIAVASYAILIEFPRIVDIGTTSVKEVAKIRVVLEAQTKELNSLKYQVRELRKGNCLQPDPN